MSAFTNCSLVLKETNFQLAFQLFHTAVYFNAKISKTKSKSFPKALLLQGPQTI